VWTAAWIVYAVGVVLALFLTDARPVTRIVLGLLWPLGPIAFLITLTILAIASVIAFPVFGIVVAVAAAAITWWVW
jgi:hypothetical protein